MDISDLKRQIEEARAAYQAIANTAPAADVRAASQKVKAAQAALTAALIDGATPCPHCDEMPHGLEHPTGKGGVEYEVGCLTCKPFLHTDGTWRAHRVRGGLLPKHAVEAWNAGPDYWMKTEAPPEAG